jgi:4-oxalocrotonate tautomerase
MPLVQVKVIEGVFSASQKRGIIERVTDAIATEAENLRPNIWVTIEEIRSGDWAIGGTPMRTDDVKALAAGKAVAERAPTPARRA